MATHTLAYAPEDPVCLVEACRKAIEWILISHTARGRLVARPWIDHPYGEEEITLLEEELLPAMDRFLSRIEEIDQQLEEAQEQEAAAVLAAGWPR
jgi:hypothetical protein